MANTYTQMYVHLVFSPKNRDALIGKTWKNELEKYIITDINGRLAQKGEVIKILDISTLKQGIYFLKIKNKTKKFIKK